MKRLLHSNLSNPRRLVRRFAMNAMPLPLSRPIDLSASLDLLSVAHFSKGNPTVWTDRIILGYLSIIAWKRRRNAWLVLGIGLTSVQVSRVVVPDQFGFCRCQDLSLDRSKPTIVSNRTKTRSGRNEQVHSTRRCHPGMQMIQNRM